MREIAGPARTTNGPGVTVGSEATRTRTTGCGRPAAHRRGASRAGASALPTARVLPDGRVVRVRAASPDEKERLKRMFSRLSPTSIYRRFHSPLPRVPEWAVEQAVEVEHADKESLVAVVGGEIVGQATYVRTMSGDEAEVAVVVEDGWQRRGIGKLLLAQLAARAGRRGIEVLTGAVLPENGAMLRLVAAFGRYRYSPAGGGYVARIPVTSPGDRLGGSGPGTEGGDYGPGSG